MSVVAGVANTIEDLFTAFLAGAAAAGWGESGTGQTRTLTKPGLSLELSWVDTGVTRNLKLYNLTQGGVTLPYGYKIINSSVLTDEDFDFPISYEMYNFSGPDEVIMVVKYANNYYQHLAFGNSPAPGMTSCLWASGSANHNHGESGSSAAGAGTVLTMSSISSSFSNSNGFHGGWFANSGAFFNEVDSVWSYTPSLGARVANTQIGATPLAGLLYSLPSEYTSTTVLLPVTMTTIRPSNTATNMMAGCLENVRLCRIDNINPLDVISYGADSWKIYPFLRKNASERNFTAKTHSGTLGYAVRQ